MSAGNGRASLPADAKHNILVVDDEPNVLASISRMLQTAGYGVLMAPSARQALAILQQADAPIHLVVTDVVMPETDGHALGRLIAELYPGLRVAYMSGFPVTDVFHRGPPSLNVPFLGKPFSPEALLATVKVGLALDCARALDAR